MLTWFQLSLYTILCILIHQRRKGTFLRQHILANPILPTISSQLFVLEEMNKKIVSSPRYPSDISCWFLVHLVSILLMGFGVVAQDNRCYLTSGGSSEIFTINEALPVDSILGRIEVNGNAAKDGDIVLSLEDDNLPIAIESYTKNLILRQKLDKEGLEGVQSISVDVSCTKTGVEEPSIIIPVRVIVTDANDNSPRFIGSPYTLNISEITVVGTVVMQDIKAIDDDQAGLFNIVEYFIERGPYSHLLAFENRLEGVLLLNSPLDFETLPKFSVKIRAQDQGDPPKSSFATLTVHVQDADDQNPKFRVEKYTAVLPENLQKGEELIISPNPIEAEDPDVDIRSPVEYFFNSDSEEYSFFELDQHSGRVSIKRPLPHNLPLPLTLVIRATQVTNKDKYSLTTLTVTTDRPIPNVLKFLQNGYVTSVLESTPPDAVILTVQTSKPVDMKIRLKLLGNSNEYFAVRDTGEVMVAKPLDFETQQQFYLRVMVSDGHQSDITSINITVINVNDNDPVFTKPRYTFEVTNPDIRPGTLIGKLQVTDGDIDDVVELSIKGPFPNLFTVSSEGEIRILNLESLNTSVCHVFVVATDNGIPPRQTSVPVTVRFPKELLQGHMMESNGKRNPFVLMVVFGVLLASLFIVIISLTIYILRRKRNRERLPTTTITTDHPPTSKLTGYVGNVQLATKPSEYLQSQTHHVGKDNPVFHVDDDVEADAVNTVKLDDPKSLHMAYFTEECVPKGQFIHEEQRETSLEDVKVNPLPRTGNGHLDDVNLDYNWTKIRKKHWLNGSIPEIANKTELDPDVSVTPLPKSSGSNRQSDLTVYF
ncbi:protocadherin beta-11-like [Tachypleus tridentatus]|uniref:protocadherin beta-11-like n=1 Tax=Tachypleus tridentatus TaxID=6853 RepID=UPI003FD4A0E3